MTTVLSATRPKCGARKRQGEGCCMRPAGWATDHPGVGRCKYHGGCTPSHRVRAQREMAQQQQQQQLAEAILAWAISTGRVTSQHESFWRGKLATDFSAAAWALTRLDPDPPR